MPQPPASAPSVLEMPGAVYSPFADRIRDHPGPLFPLHVGDTWMEPFEGGRMQDQRVEDRAGLHRYCDTQGVPELVDALIEKLRTRNSLTVERDGLLVAAGATGALAAVLGAIIRPAEEVLILAPFWPLIRGAVQAFHGTPVEVPFYDRVDSAAAAVTAVEAKLSDRSVALYISSPSNPTGRVLPGDWLEALAKLAQRENLWLLSDEVYEDFVYRGEHVSCARFAPERSLSFYSFSKAYGMAGNRVGYVAGPASLVTEARKVSTHTFYHPPTAGQWAGLRALEGGAKWIENARASYRAAGDDAARVLGQDAPGGSAFFFIDASPFFDERGMSGFLEDCFEDGVLVAPGASSGQAYSDWIRLCYTSVRPELAADAVRRLARRMK